MKKLSLLLVVLVGFTACAQELKENKTKSFDENYTFKTVIDVDATSVKSQGRTGTCWSFSTSSFVESEILRKTGQMVDVSEMYNARKSYERKAENYILRGGNARFSEGGLSHDVMNNIRENGIVPNDVYDNTKEEKGYYDHSKLVEELEHLVKSVVHNKDSLKMDWHKLINTTLDKYFGAEPHKFKINGKTYSPRSYRDYLKIDADDYITITSFTHHPFYKPFILEIPDNYANGAMYNLRLDKTMKTLEEVVRKGYSVALDVDVSEAGFSAKAGMAILPKEAVEVLKEQGKLFEKIVPEQKITAEYRQKEFYNGATTDDHLMHITGLLKDQNGNLYYKVKNSWGSKGLGNGGYVYMSVPYLRLKMISFMVSKEALNADLKKKLALD
jgi:bleomycin hydrolase